MRQLKVKELLSILEAVDYLSSLSELDITIAPQVVSQEEKHSLHPYRWLDQNEIRKNQQLVIQVFSSIHHYLQEIKEKHPEQLDDKHVLKGIQSILTIMDEAVEKIEKFTELFKEAPALENLMELEEYRKLQEFVTDFILPHFTEQEDYWEADLGVQEEELIGIAKKGLRGIEDVKEDRFYDLFYIRKEDRKPFYDYDMVRRLKLLYDFDELVEMDEEENSFLRIRQLQDKDFYQKASSILQTSNYLIGSFYKESMKMKAVPMVGAMNKALMALMLAANPRNWHSGVGEETQLFKSSAEYFGDFHYYLREVLQTPEYKKMLAVKSDSTPALYQVCFSLVHKLCASYFQTVSLQKEIVSFIRRMIHLGSKMAEVAEPMEKNPHLWKELLWEDDSIRHLLQKQPSGPIRRVVESFLKGDIGKGWDPLSHKNVPTHLFTLSREGKDLAFLRMPAPLVQKSIQSAEVPSEFEAFLKNGLLEDRHQRFLLVNLQDRTSWEEHARSEALENFSKKPDWIRVFSLIGLPKKTDFYFQKDVYENLDDAPSFIEQLIEQFQGGKQCGFYWPQTHFEEGLSFTKEVVLLIHSVFFEHRKTLKIDERQSFIDIFYFFLMLKAIDLFHPDFMALSCKDSIDTGAAASGGFYSYLRMMISNEPWKEEEKDLLLWILYAPALFFRERAIQRSDLRRLVQSMHAFQDGVLSQKPLLLKECKKLFERELWNSIEIKKAG